MVDLVAWDNAGDRLGLSWSDGRCDTVHALWLRDNSPSAEARHANGQKLFEITDLDDTTVVESVSNGVGSLRIRFAPDGHEADFDLGWLRSHAAPPPASTLRLWGAELADTMPVHGFDTVMADAGARHAWLIDMRDLGFTLLTGVPSEPGTLIDVAESFGFVRETNYGRFFEVRSDPEPINLANTGMGLSCHTDNPYRDPVPGLQLLHCLVGENDGGDSVVVDGFKAATLLRDEDGTSFDLLTRYAVPFRFASADTELCARARLITLDDRGEIAEVRFNNRSISTFDLPADVMPAFYRAYRRFAEVLQRPELEVMFKAGPGDLFMVDNQRVLHGRKTVGGSGRRHLQGCYADKDSMLSTLRVLERQMS
ncbi:MAG: gamma-butyrobetaine dioxygenase [Rhodospirillaceae bacterium]|nr:gamma-butyrobetaine dioxygenase [Rhodospirillaceae bacterium]|tara:strand:- start:54423 stop:55526 length:1104 start_codon:yes stop_codon:yes gene_type:complete